MGIATQDKIYNGQIQTKMSPSLFVSLAIQFVNVIHNKHQIQGAIGNLHPSQLFISAQDSMLSWNAYATNRQPQYMAPEQLGMMNRKPDIRSDLYTVGIILYEWFTGRYPYPIDSSKDWSYIHLYEEVCTEGHNNGVYEAYIYQIIQRLLNKSPDNRYQSGYGLLYDLKQLEQAIHSSTDFVNIGEGDAKRLFQLHDYEIKHDYMINNLLAYRDQAYQESNKTLHVILGDKGMGKTTFLAQLQDLLEALDERVVSIKCINRNSEPYEYVKELQTHLLQKLIELDSQTIEACSTALEKELEGDLEKWRQYAPLSSIIWNDDTGHLSLEQAPFNPELCLKAAAIMCKFVNPAAIIIDQLENIDYESYMLVHKLAQNKPYPSLFIILACQKSLYDKAIESYHLSEQIQDAHLLTTDIPSLSYVQVRDWIQYACREDSIRISQLSRMVYHWSNGNPGHIISLFQKWKQQKVFYYDEALHSWQWKARLMSNLVNEPDNWKVTSLYNLPQETIECLNAAAVCGLQFSIHLLAQVMGLDASMVKLQLHSAILEGIITYHDERDASLTGEDETLCMFVINELQEHIYNTIEPDKRAALHKTISMIQEDQQSDTAIFHLNQAISILSAELAEGLAQSNFHKGMAAYQAKNYKEAAQSYKYALIALKQHDINLPSLTRRSTLYLAISLAYCNEIAEAKTYFKDVESELSQLDDDDYLLACLHQLEFNSFHNNKRVVDVAKQGLTRFGYNIKPNSNVLNAFVQTSLTLKAIRNYYQNHTNLKVCEEKTFYAQCQIMRSQYFGLLNEDPIQLLISYSKFIRYGLKKGINIAFVELIASYEILIQRVLSFGYSYWPKDFFKQLTHLIARMSNESFRSMFAYSVIQQLQSPIEADSGLLKTIHASLEQSETMYVNMAALTFMVINQGKLSHLEELLKLFEGQHQHLFNISTLHYKKYAIDYYYAWKDENQLYSFIQLQENGEAEDIDNYIAIQRAEQAYLASEYKIGMKWITCARKKELQPDWIRNRRLRIYEALLAVELYGMSEGKQRQEYKSIVLKCMKKMKSWQGAYGINSSSYYLIQAEAHRLMGQLEQALQAYERAVKQAKKEEHWLLEGIAYERQASAFREKGSDSGYLISLVDALSAYRKWGAQAKVEQLIKKYPRLMLNTNEEERVAEGELIANSSSASTDKQTSGDATMLTYAHKAWQWLENMEYKQDLNYTLKTLLDLIKQQTSAERGLLLQLNDDQSEVIAATESVEDALPLETIAALPVLRYVHRTGETILLGQADQSQYKSDNYIKANQIKSLLCMNVKLQAKSRSWLLCLESRTISNIFSKQTVEMIQLIVTRFAYLHYINQADISHDAVDKLPLTNSIKLVETDTNKNGLIEELTNRELEVLKLLCGGYSNKDIAQTLFISESTVKSHIYNIYGKFGVKRRTQAIKRAEELNLLQ